MRTIPLHPNSVYHPMSYEQWTTALFSFQSTKEFLEADDVYASVWNVDNPTVRDYIRRALRDNSLRNTIPQETLAVGWSIVFDNWLSNYPFVFIDASDEDDTVRTILDLKLLYTNIFDRFCLAKVISIGNDIGDGQMGHLCHMLWDGFVLHPINATPKMVTAGLEVLSFSLRSKNENSCVSCIHGLGHWVNFCPEAASVLKQWLKEAPPINPAIYKYALQAITGSVQ